MPAVDTYLDAMNELHLRSFNIPQESVSLQRKVFAKRCLISEIINRYLQLS